MRLLLSFLGSLATVPCVFARAPNVADSFGPYADWRPLDLYAPLSENCTLTQVNILQRHGARFPTRGMLYRIEASLSKLRSVGHFNDPNFDFIHNYSCRLEIDNLVPAGRKQSFDAGVQIATRYENLARKQQPFVRASSSIRVVESSEYWIKGFRNISDHSFFVPLVLPDSPGFNDTLSNHQCVYARYEELRNALTEWLQSGISPIAARVNLAAPGGNLSSFDVISLMSICPLETIAREEKSQFCSLFSERDFAAYEYYWDLQKYFMTGYGNDLGAVQGAGWVTELISRLTRNLVPDYTQTNRTLNGDPTTFPLDRAIYVDFTHDNEMTAIYAALGLFKDILSPIKAEPNRTWVASQLVPFASRLTVEKYSCTSPHPITRILLNDRVVACPANNQASCLLDDFIQSQIFALKDAQTLWSRCVVPQTENQQRQIIFQAENI